MAEHKGKQSVTKKEGATYKEGRKSLVKVGRREARWKKKTGIW